MEILNCRQMSDADNYTINEIGIPSAVLMENAAAAVTEEVLTRFQDVMYAAVAAGPGNNGGDGFAVARLLTNAGIKCDVYFTSTESKLTGDALTNYNILKKFGVTVIEVKSGSIPSFHGYDLVIDALLGTGLSKPLSGIYAQLVNSINLSAEYIISVDIPTGLSGDSHNVNGVCVDADLTVTFARPKLPHVMFPARKFCGEIVVADISIPDFAIDKSGHTAFLLESSTLPLLEYREQDSHKGHFGHAVIAGGSEGKTGACFIASLACAKSGAGLTTSALPGKLLPAAEFVNPEIMSFAVGTAKHFTAAGISKFIKFLQDKTVCAVGPGIGTNDETLEFLDELIDKTDIPMVIDADGINLLTEKTIKKLKDRCVLTPHIGEFARLIGKDNEQVMENRLELAREFAVKNGIVLVLKSADTITAVPDGSVFINIAGSPALAKGGSGDCLTGLITGFVSQGYELSEAACLGTYILGRTAEIVANQINEKSVMTSDIIENIWKTLDELEEDA